MEDLYMPRITTVDWLPIINECRTSGLSDHQWCKENDVSYSTFYYHVRRLQKEACELPASARKCTIPIVQEVVQLNFNEPEVQLPHYSSEITADSEVSAISLQMNNVILHISNSANAAVIANTIQALQSLC